MSNSYWQHLRAHLIELLKVRTIMTLAFTGATIWGFMTDRVSTEVFISMVAATVTYYFQRKEIK